MQYRKFKEVLRDVIDARPEQPKAVFITSFSVNPPKLMETLRDAHIAKRTMKRVFVFFQRYSFRRMDANLAEPPFVGAKRAKAIAAFDKKQKYTAFRIRSSSPVKHQLHLKTALVLYDDHLQLVQFSRNLDLRNGEQPEIIYVGLPQNMDSLIRLLLDIFDQGGGYVEDRANASDQAYAHLVAMLALYKNLGHLYDPRSHMIIQGFRTSFGHEFNRVLRAVRDGPTDYMYKAWQGLRQESVLLLHFPYVNNGLETNMCDAVVGPMSLSLSEKEKTSVELTYSGTPNLHNFPHESWICRLTGKGADAQMLWFFLVSCNLTLPSWVPLKTALNGENLTRYNLECGVLRFYKPNRQPANLLAYVQTLMKPGDWSTLTTVKCNVNRGEVPVQALPLEINDNARCNVDKATCLLLYNPALSNWQRFRNAKSCLLKGYLTGLVGASNILESDIMKYCYFMRWAFYDYLFNDLGKAHPIGRLGVYDEATTRKYFLLQIRADPAERHPWVKCKSARTTLEVLVDIFVRWSIAFDMYDSRINATRPVVNQRTLMTLYDARCGERVVEDAHQKFRKAHTPYDTLTFMMQSMNASASVWWTCPKGHTFYYTPKNVLLHQNACMVCAKYHDVLALYEILQVQAGVSCLTVEFPLIRKLTLNKQMAIGAEANGEDGNPLPMDKGRQYLLRYDIFFWLDKKYACAIEFDDASHNSKSLNMENINVSRPNADAAKNVLSSAMGIHLMRIWAKSKRPNAKARLQLLVTTFLKAVRENKVCLKSLDTNFDQNVKKFHREGEQGWKALNLLTSAKYPYRPTQIEPPLPVALARLLPISFVFATDGPKGSVVTNDATLITSMELHGKAHPCLMPQRVIRVESQVDRQTNYAYHIMLQEWRRAPKAPPNPDFVVWGGPQGRLMDKCANGVNGLALVGKALPSDDNTSVLVEEYALEPKNVGSWRMVQQKQPRPVYDSRLTRIQAIAQQYVRIKSPDAVRPQGQRCPFPPGMNEDYKAWSGVPRRNDDDDDDDDDEDEDEDEDEDDDDDDDDDDDNPPPPQTPTNWPKAASWALPGNHIRFLHPTRDEAWEKNNHKEWNSGKFEDAVVLEVKEYGGLFVTLEWWISVQREPGTIRYVTQSEFQYVFRPVADADQAPLSTIFAAVAAVAAEEGQRQQRERRPSGKVKDNQEQERAKKSKKRPQNQEQMKEARRGGAKKKAGKTRRR